MVWAIGLFLNIISGFHFAVFAQNFITSILPPDVTNDDLTKISHLPESVVLLLVPECGHPASVVDAVVHAGGHRHDAGEEAVAEGGGGRGEGVVGRAGHGEGVAAYG